MQTETSKLRKSMSRLDVFLFLVCTLVGLDTLGSVASKGAQGLFWLIFLAVFFFLPYALLTSELGSAFPQEGGPYLWTKYALGRPVAAVNAIFYWISNPIWLGGALTITAVTSWNRFFFELGGVGKYIFGLVFIWSCVFAAVVSFGIGKWITIIGAWARVALLAFFTFSVALYGVRHGAHGIAIPELAPTYDGFIALVPLLFFNYVGFELPSAAAGEMVDPQRDVPFAVMRSALSAVLCYGTPIVAMLLVLPTERITGLTGFIDAMQTVFTVYGGNVETAADGSRTIVLAGAGRVLGGAAALGFIWALATSGTTWIMGADRSQAVACLDGAGPRALGRFSSRFGTPVALNLASGVVATVVMLAAFAVAGASAEKFFVASLNLGISTTTISYLGIFPALYVLRRRQPDTVRPFRIPGGDRGAFVVSLVTFSWALLATACLVWPGLGRRGNGDLSLPAGFVTLDAQGSVLSSQRLLFELTQLVPLFLLAGLGALFLMLGRRGTRATAPDESRQAPMKNAAPAPLTIAC